LPRNLLKTLRPQIITTAPPLHPVEEFIPQTQRNLNTEFATDFAVAITTAAVNMAYQFLYADRTRTSVANIHMFIALAVVEKYTTRTKQK